MADSEQSCEARIDRQQADRDAHLRMMFTRDAPDARENPAWALKYIEFIVAETSYDPSDDEQDVIDLFTRTIQSKGPRDNTWMVQHVAESNAAYGGAPLADAVNDLLETMTSDTEDDRLDQVSESILEAKAVVTVTLRIDLSTGGPADYLTADLDKEERTLSNIRYHFADWHDHADRPVEPGSPLGQLAAHYSEIVAIGEHI